ncbi:MAG TPA: ATP phosphoribosyltransferase, partial [Longimicrobiaceae bacterium]|nr:ATP phosphoribosyltransferase [Longimicrobiaceae bacterium]
ADIPEFVADGIVDSGITGRDLVEEVGRPVEVLADLGFGGCRLSVAASEESGITSIDELPAGARVATAFPRLARRYFQESGLEVSVVPLSGATEIAPHIGLAEVIVDLVATGSTLKTNGLREIATVLESTAVLISNCDLLHDPAREPEIRGLAAALESVVQARSRRYLMANVPRSALADVRRILPGISGPTIVEVMDGDEHVAAHAVVDAVEIYRVIGELKAIGAEGVLVTKIERLMP